MHDPDCGLIRLPHDLVKAISPPPIINIEITDEGIGTLPNSVGSAPKIISLAFRIIALDEGIVLLFGRGWGIVHLLVRCQPECSPFQLALRAAHGALEQQ